MSRLNRLSLHRLYTFADKLPDRSIETRRYTQGEIIYASETYARGLFFLDKGCVLIKAINPNGEEDIVRILGPGNFFGLLPLIQRTRYTSTALVLEDNCQVRFIARAIVSEALNDQRFVIGFLKILANRIKDNESHLLHIKNKNADERLAYALSSLDYIYSKNNKTHSPLITLKKKYLARYIGVTPETLSRRLSDFEKEGLIELHLKGIKVIDHAQVLNMADGLV